MSRKIPTGIADSIAISDASFKIAHRNFETNHDPNPKKRKREGRGDSSTVYGVNAYKGPWADYSKPALMVDDVVPSEDESVEIVYEEATASENEDEAQDAANVVAKRAGSGTRARSNMATAYAEDAIDGETTTFHGSTPVDYQGRTYMHVPLDLDIDLRRENPPDERKNYVPKKTIHVWRGHSGPITQTRFFPDSGHLLLSASADSKVMLWDVYHQRELLRSFSGHRKSVIDIDFTPDGRNFLSASYDRSMKCWDTETGSCLKRFSTGATPHVLRVNPASPSEFIAGMSDNKIVQFDTRVDNSVKPIQEYDYHLGPVNTLTFCDQNRRFISTSDDKSLRAWEYGINVPIKLIASPEMYPLVRSSMHPNEKYVAYQSADNQIVVYSAGDKFRQNRKKGFFGANTAGYAIDVAISPSGEFITSGDSAGWLCFWDWRTGRMLHKFEASGKEHSAVVSVSWHPRETSKVVSGSLDGSLRYWD